LRFINAKKRLGSGAITIDRCCNELHQRADP
jgi:hypothetical protein